MNYNIISDYYFWLCLGLIIFVLVMYDMYIFLGNYLNFIDVEIWNYGFWFYRSYKMVLENFFEFYEKR